MNNKLTTRVSNQDLVQQAKAQYEKTQESKIPTEIFDLVSEGKIYPATHPLRSGTIEMRYMTAYDEDILTTRSFHEKGIVLDRLIDALIVTPGVTVDDIKTVDKNGLVIAARILSYGKQYPVRVKTPEGNIIESEVNLSALQVRKLDINSDTNGEFDYTTDRGDRLKFCFPNSTETYETTSELLNAIITQVNETRSKNDIADFIKYKFMALDSRKFQTYVIDNSPEVLLSSEFEYDTAEGKKETFTAGFQLGSDLFWF